MQAVFRSNRFRVRSHAPRLFFPRFSLILPFPRTCRRRATPRPSIKWNLSLLHRVSSRREKYFNPSYGQRRPLEGFRSGRAEITRGIFFVSGLSPRNAFSTRNEGSYFLRAASLPNSGVPRSIKSSKHRVVLLHRYFAFRRTRYLRRFFNGRPFEPIYFFSASRKRSFR